MLYIGLYLRENMKKSYLKPQDIETMIFGM